MGVLKGLIETKLTEAGIIQERRRTKNREALDGCYCHDFRLIPRRDWLYDVWYRCRRCYGEIQQVEYEWYMKGRSHGQTAHHLRRSQDLNP